MPSAYGEDFNQLDRNAWMFNTAKHRERMLMFNTRSAYDNNAAGYTLPYQVMTGEIGQGRAVGGRGFGAVPNVGIRQRFSGRHPGNAEVNSLGSAINSAVGLGTAAVGAVVNSRNYANQLKVVQLKQQAASNAISSQTPSPSTFASPPMPYTAAASSRALNRTPKLGNPPAPGAPKGSAPAPFKGLSITPNWVPNLPPFNQGRALPARPGLPYNQTSVRSSVRGLNVPPNFNTQYQTAINEDIERRKQNLSNL